MRWLAMLFLALGTLPGCGFYIGGDGEYFKHRGEPNYRPQPPMTQPEKATSPTTREILSSPAKLRKCQATVSLNSNPG